MPAARTDEGHAARHDNLQCDVAPPEMPQRLQDQIARLEADALPVKLLRVKLDVAVLLDVELLDCLVVVVNERVLEMTFRPIQHDDLVNRALVASIALDAASASGSRDNNPRAG